MAWNGYFTYEGIEILNAARVEHYMTALNTTWFRPIYNAHDLPYALGERYGSPLVDDAPWVDGDIPESYEFYGAYPLDVKGIEDSTVESTVTQSTSNGAALGNIRYASREVVFSAVLFGEREAAVEYGFRWLKRALAGDPCHPIDRHAGAEMRYLSAEPVIEFGEPSAPVSTVIYDGGIPSSSVDDVYDGGGPGAVDVLTLDGGPVTRIAPAQEGPDEALDPTECLPPLVRRLRKCTTTGRPTVTGKRIATDGTYVWMVQWTITAGDSFEYGLPRPVFQNYRAGAVPVIADGVLFAPNDTSLFDDFEDVPCPTPMWTPVYDPDCSPVAAPPSVPDVPLGCWTAPEVWKRWWITTPAQYVPRWDMAVPVLDIYAPDIDIRGLRIRFYPDDDVSPAASIANCGWDYDMLVTYIPEGYRLRIDATSQTITAMDGDGVARAAGSLVMGSDGKPFEWPELSCDQAYVVVFDMAPTGNVAMVKPVVSLSLVMKVAA